jgi:hypothetical protein
MAKIYKDIKLIFDNNMHKLTLLSRETFLAVVKINTD